MSPSLRMAVCDLNGQARGKRLPHAFLAKVEESGAQLPLSVLNVDVFGADIEGSPLVFASGDADGQLIRTDRDPMPMPWLEGQALVLPMIMVQDGSPYLGDPRGVLMHQVAALGQRGVRAMVGTELEFTLCDDSDGGPSPPRSPLTGHVIGDPQVDGLAMLDEFSPFFDDLYAGAEAMGITAEAAMSEAGVGQFEVNLAHRDALAAADDAWFFKMLVKGTARRHGLCATFLAKPYPEDAGNGMHVHVSLVDKSGANVFNDGGASGSAQLKSAIAGCLETMPAATLIFAPHGLSYDRFVSEAHAPTGLAWGYDNRTVALRVPAGPPAARRLEHRTAGGDANPYLLLAAILSGVRSGLERQLAPEPPLEGNAYEVQLSQIPTTWGAAIAEFEQCGAQLLNPVLADNLVRTKRQEQQKMEGWERERALRVLLDLA